MRKKLIDAFRPVELNIVNDSAGHAGHRAGPEATGETHFSVEIVSDAFRGKPLIERQRMVHRILSDELGGPVHALAIKTRAPGE